MSDELNTETINKINELAESLKENGLAMNMEEALEKAKTIIIGAEHGEKKSLEEYSEEIEETKEYMEEPVENASALTEEEPEKEENIVDSEPKVSEEEDSTKEQEE